MIDSPALEFRNVSFAYPGGCEALHNVSFSIAEGERVALLGLNGSGKSTLLLHTNALLHPSSGEVMIDGTTVTRKNEGVARRSVGMVFQDSDDQLFMPTVEADVAFGPRNMGLDNQEIAARVEEALRLTGCTELKNRQPFQLSGGQKKMVSIATVLSMRPETLVMDEPTSGLDYEARGRFIEIISALPHTLLMASHDMELVRSLCDRAIIIEKGRIVDDRPLDEITYPPR